ncbi:MAG TPA: hypothetical protein PK719_05140 [Bacteroidales bacterium]|jgi:hypothetical protein|nr:hypothetical protein [Bacteroidales bacterium]OQB62296.1 MAG: hypothetical protein BWX96_01462 [Bacteroidetes bacterium ADurb.Bin145]HOU02838.1 hypothetical protein [Bacteroidales bacterium]HQG63019.1 hypothetical protein [Bacteroidales bacterium]HQK67811.1 hypothetical protein [Bacteroidales bacterium]
MKKLITTSILAVLVTFATTVFAQDYPDEYLGLPGDNLNLYAVMKLFQESETLEGFERGLNDENNRINNLDLNGDNLIDYITVSDYVDGNVHTIVLRVALDRNESQDVAVFTVEKLRNGSVEIQLIGDEALYGRNYIIEPIYDETPNPGYIGNRRNVTNVTIIRTTPYEVAAWPVVRFIYMPNYVVWRSSWYWGYYPPAWRPWRPFYWHYYYGYHYNFYHHYYVHYRLWDRPRYTRYNEYYYRGIRAQSPRVYARIKEGNYRETYARPEQRREGEALFTKLHPDQPRRTAENTPAVNNRSSVSRSSRDRNSEATRQGAPVQSRTTERTRERTTDQNTGTSTRTTSTVRERSKERTTGQNPGTTTRTTTTTTERTKDQANGQNQGNANRSTTTTVERNRGTSAGQARTSTRSTTVAKPERSSSKETPKASRQSTRTERAATRQSAKENSKSNTESKKAEKNKESNNSNNSRRR